MMASAIIDGNIWKKIFEKIFPSNFRKSHEILDHFDKSIKSYIKMFEAADLLATLPSPLPAQVGLTVFKKTKFVRNICNRLPNGLFVTNLYKTLESF